MNKSSLRKTMIEHLKQIHPAEKLAIENKLTSHLFQTEIWKNATIIGTTVSQAFEWNTKPIIEQAWKERKTVVVPKCSVKKKLLTFYKITNDNDLQIGYANIMEPRVETTEKTKKNLIELLIVPGIIFDQFGYRIGFGGGYYDRFLVDFKGITVSLLSKKQLIDTLPVNSFDIPVQFIITEDGCKKTFK